MRYKNIIFDLDGTLTDSGEGVMNSVVHAFHVIGITPPPRQELRKFIGPPLTYSFPRYGVPDELVDKCTEYYRDCYENMGEKMNNFAYPGVKEFLARLKAAGCKLYVATSKPTEQAEEVLERFDIAQYFDFLAGASYDRSRENKSDVIRYLLDTIGGTSEAVMVGDTRFDILGAAEFGIPGIGVTWGYGTAEDMLANGANAIADTWDELFDIITAEA